MSLTFFEWFILCLWFKPESMLRGLGKEKKSCFRISILHTLTQNQWSNEITWRNWSRLLVLSLTSLFKSQYFIKWQINLVMIPRRWDAWVVLLYYTSFASPCGLFSRCAVVISWKNQPCVVVSTSFKWRQILCLTGISDIKLQHRKSTDL